MNETEIEKLVEDFVNIPLTEKEFRKKLEELIKKKIEKDVEGEK